MHDELWAGVHFKLDSAWFHYQEMIRAATPPERNPYDIPQIASGATLFSGWQRRFFAHFDAFLAAARSIPEIIQCCFGHDYSDAAKDWFGALDPDECRRRDNFNTDFRSDLGTFRALPLGTKRNISLHRTGVPDATVTVSGQFGVVHTGNAVRRLPESEPPAVVDPSLPFRGSTAPLTPRFDDFFIDGQPLFAVCQDYHVEASELVNRASVAVTQVHGKNPLTAPNF